MNIANRARVLLILAILSSLTATVRAEMVVNGDFETGDFTGWTASAFDVSLNPIDPSPFVFVTSGGGNNVARFNTGQFADGLFIAGLEQTYTVAADKPFITFDFTLPNVQPDPTGTGSGVFQDGLFTLAFNDGTTFYDLLLIDKDGAVADPFGTAPGTVSLGSPSAPGFDSSFSADLSSLVGNTITLSFDLIQEDDGFQFGLDIDHVLASATATTKVVPEAASFACWFLIIGTCGIYGWWRRRKRAAA